MTITGSNTTSFGFQKLGSNDDAGYSTINEVVDGIDTILNASDRLIKASQTPTVAYVITGDGVDWVRGLVVTNSITDLNVTTGKLADLAVTTGKINDLAVTTAKIADLNVTTGKINDLAVTTGKIADLNVTTGKIDDLAVTTGKIAADAVTLGTKTSGNYVATITGTANQIASSAATSGEGTTHTLSLVSNTTLPGNPTVGTATGTYISNPPTNRVADVAYVNDAVANVNSSGSVALSGDVGGTAGSTAITPGVIVNDDLNAALRAFLVPTGTVSAFAGSSAPTGYLLCDGTTTHSTTTYAALFAVLGYTYGGSGATFGVPNLKGRTVIGVGVGTEITGVLGTVQGAKEVTLTAAQSGTTAHGHTGSTVGTGVTVTDPQHGHPSSTVGTGVTVTDGGHGHTNRVGIGAAGVTNSSDVLVRSNGGTQDGAFAATNATTTGITAALTSGALTITSNSTGVTAALTSGALTIANSTATAASSAHTNIQPSLPLNYIIKV